MATFSRNGWQLLTGTPGNFQQEYAVITNTRVLVSNILADLSDGLSFEDIKKSYPNITNDDIKAVMSTEGLTPYYTCCLTNYKCIL